METLLDRHLATFDEWLRAEFVSLSSQSQPHYLAVVTLLDQLDPKEYTWQRLLTIIPHAVNLPFIPYRVGYLFGGTKYIEFSRIISKFLMNRERAGSFWVNSRTYANLARHILKVLHDK